VKITKWEDYKSDMPEGVSGDWSVVKYVITEQDAEFHNMRSMFSFSCKGSRLVAGDYTKLMVGRNTMMSDTRDEIVDMYSFFLEAKGNILINGLGLGVGLKAVLDNDKVDFVTVIEKEQDVIDLIAPRFLNDVKYKDRVDIIHADAFEWKPPKGVRYDVVWHDIWLNICTGNLDEMSKLHRKYGKRCDWQQSWKRDMLLYERQKEKRAGW